MDSINRRRWLKVAGLASSAALTTGKIGLDETQTMRPDLIVDQPLVRLSSNENKYAPSDKIRQAMIGAMDLSNLYTPGHYGPLIEKLAMKEGVTKDHILLVSGSNEGLRLVGLCYGRNGGEIVTSTPTYKALLSYAQEFGGSINSAPLDEDLKYDLDELESRISSKTQMVFFCNPNNPTGTIVDGQKAIDFCKRASEKTMVFSDEAYNDYIEDADYPTMVPLIKEGRNVMVSRTFSKVYGMAGVRVGYLIAQPDVVKKLKPRVMSYVNMMGVHGAIAALDDQEFYKYSLKKNKEAKNHIYRVADKLGLRYVKSHTNFVFVHTGKNIDLLRAAMQNEGVLVGRAFPPLLDWCRISTGNEQDMAMWEKAMYKVFA